MIHRRLLQLAGAVPSAIALLTLAGAILVALNLAFAVTAAAAISALMRGDQQLWVLIAALAGIAVLRAATVALREPLTARIGASVRIRLRAGLLTKVAAIRSDERRSGEVTSTVLEGVDGLESYYTRYLPQLILVLFVPATVVALTALQDAAAAIVLGAFTAVAVIAPRFWDALLLRNGRSRWGAFTGLADDYVEALQSIPLLRSFGAGARVGRDLDTRAEQLRVSTMSQLRVSLVESAISALAMHLGTVLAVIAAVVAVLGGGAPAGAIAVLLLARECFRPLTELGEAWHAGYLGLTAVDGLDRLLARPAGLQQGVRETPVTGAASVELQDVRFRHPGSGRGLRGVTARIRAGETVAVIGRSGSGKSTLGRLLEREADPDCGRILVDGTDLRDLTTRTRAAAVVVVPQDPVLFAWSVRDNLRLHRPDAGDTEIVRAAVAADVDDVIRALPDGYDTVLAENGRQLSGGQHQRLAIARALVARPALLVLDEVTSALDPATEQRVMDGIRAHDPHRTTILIAHRESACAHADRWMRMDDGLIVATGDGAPAATTAEALR